MAKEIIYGEEERQKLLAGVDKLADAGIVLLLEFMDNTIQSADDIEKHLGIPVLAQINRLEDGGEGR